MKQINRKGFSGLLAGVLALTLLAGCGAGGEKEPESPAATPENAALSIAPTANPETEKGNGIRLALQGPSVQITLCRTLAEAQNVLADNSFDLLNKNGSLRKKFCSGPFEHQEIWNHRLYCEKP